MEIVNGHPKPPDLKVYEINLTGAMYSKSYRLTVLLLLGLNTRSLSLPSAAHLALHYFNFNYSPGDLKALVMIGSMCMSSHTPYLIPVSMT